MFNWTPIGYFTRSVIEGQGTATFIYVSLRVSYPNPVKDKTNLDSNEQSKRMRRLTETNVLYLNEQFGFRPGPTHTFLIHRRRLEA